MSGVDSFLYWGLVVSQFLTFCAYAVVTAGAALLQQKANTLTLFDGLDEAGMTKTLGIYNDAFQSTTYIIPYPQRPQYQFQYQWWIIEFEFFVFVLTLTCTIFPRIIPRMKPVALTFIAAALVLVMDNINAIFFLLRTPAAMDLFDGYRIQTAQAGLIMVGCCNWLTIIFLGAYMPTVHVPASHVDIKANANNAVPHHVTPIHATPATAV